MRNVVEEYVGETCLTPRSRKTKEKLSDRKKELEEELKCVEEAISLFDEHPYLAQALDLLGKVGI